MVSVLRLGSEEDDGQMLVIGRTLQPFSKLISIHLWHHHVGDDKVEVMTLHLLYCLTSVHGSHHLILSLQQLFHEQQEFSTVLHNEEFVCLFVLLFLYLSILFANHRLHQLIILNHLLIVDDVSFRHLHLYGVLLIYL